MYAAVCRRRTPDISWWPRFVFFNNNTKTTLVQNPVQTSCCLSERLQQHSAHGQKREQGLTRSSPSYHQYFVQTSSLSCLLWKVDVNGPYLCCLLVICSFAELSSLFNLSSWPCFFFFFFAFLPAFYSIWPAVGSFFGKVKQMLHNSSYCSGWRYLSKILTGFCVTIKSSFTYACLTAMKSVEKPFAYW